MQAVAPSIDAEAGPKGARIMMVAPPARGGLARHVLSLIEGLRRDGYEVGLACPPEGPLAEAASTHGFPMFEMPFGSRAGVPRAALCAVRLSHAVSEMEARIVHTHSLRAGLIGALAIAAPASLVATIHNYPPRAEGMRPRRRRDRWAVGLVCRRAARLITVSDALRRDLVELRRGLAKKTVTIPNGVAIPGAPESSPDDARARLGLPQEGPLVGMIARLAPQKGVQEFLHAAHAVAKAAEGVGFVVAGDGPLREEAEALRGRLGLEDRLLLLGEVAAASDLIEALDLLVVASSSEGSSVVAMEAMAMSKPVVATAVGGVPEVVADGETGLLVSPSDPSALAAAILWMLERPERAREMGERGRQRAAAHFDASLMVERTEAVYSDLLREQLERQREER